MRLRYVVMAFFWGWVLWNLIHIVTSREFLKAPEVETLQERLIHAGYQHAAYKSANMYMQKKRSERKKKKNDRGRSEATNSSSKTKIIRLDYNTSVRASKESASDPEAEITYCHPLKPGLMCKQVVLTHTGKYRNKRCWWDAQCGFKNVTRELALDGSR